MQRVPLAFAAHGAPAAGWAALRALSGADEEAVHATDTAQAIALLDRLLVPEAGAALGPGDAATLTASDRDRLLAAIHAGTFGSRIACVLHCAACAAPFDVDFVLTDLLASLAADTEAPAMPDGELHLADGRRVRLPRGTDELAVQALPPDAAAAALLARCLIEGDAATDDILLAETLERAAPIVDVDLDATCPECGAPAQAHFDLQHYLLAAIRQEAPSRLAEIHLLAAMYGWGLREILDLPRDRRRAFAVAIERDRSLHVGTF
jgi:hypothetical protein